MGACHKRRARPRRRSGWLVAVVLAACAPPPGGPDDDPRRAPFPEVREVLPDEGAAGTVVQIRGHLLADADGAYEVGFGGVWHRYARGSSWAVTAVVPVLETTGPVDLSVATAQGTGRPVTFTVLGGRVEPRRPVTALTHLQREEFGPARDACWVDDAHVAVARAFDVEVVDMSEPLAPGIRSPRFVTAVAQVACVDGEVLVRTEDNRVVIWQGTEPPLFWRQDVRELGAVSPLQDYLVATDSDGHVMILDGDDGNRRWVDEGDGLKLGGAAWHPNNRWVSFLHHDGRALSTVDVHYGLYAVLNDRATGAIGWHPDGDTYAFGYNYPTDAHSYRYLIVMPWFCCEIDEAIDLGHVSPALLRWDDDGEFLTMGHWNRTENLFEIFDHADYERRWRFGTLRASARRFDWAPDGVRSLVVDAFGELTVFDHEARTQSNPFRYEGNGIGRLVRLGAAGPVAVGRAGAYGRVEVRPTGDGEPWSWTSFERGAIGLSGSGDGERAAVLGNEGVVRVVATESGELLDEWASNDPDLYDVRWSPAPGGPWALVGEGGFVKVHFPDGDGTTRRFSAGERRVGDLAWSRDGRWLTAVVPRSSELTFYRAGDGRTSTIDLAMPNLNTSLVSVAWSPTSDVVAVGLSTGHILLRGAEGDEIATILVRARRSVERLDWAPNGHHIAALLEGEELYVVDPVTAATVHPPVSVPLGTEEMVWTGDSRRIVVGGEFGLDAWRVHYERN